MSFVKPWVVALHGPLSHGYGPPSSTLLTLTDSSKQQGKLFT